MFGSPTRASQTAGPSRWRRSTAGAATAVMVGTLLPLSAAGAVEEPSADAVEVKLLATNDFHGRIGRNFNPANGEPAPPSSAWLSAIFKTIRADHPHTLHVDGGDLVGASSVLSNIFRDEPTVRVMNEIGLDVGTVGNHEFDRGQEDILWREDGGPHPEMGDFHDPSIPGYPGPFEGADFTTLATNVEVTATGETLLGPYEIREVDGVAIGFLGVTTVDTPTVVNPTGIEGLEFHPEAEAVNEWVPVLEAEDVDAIVVLMHEGGRQDGNANECINFRGAAAEIIDDLDPAVDVVVTAHTHQSYVCDLAGGPLVTSANEYGAMYTEIDLTIVPGVGVVDRDATNHSTNAARRSALGITEPDPAIVELIDYYEELAGPTLAEQVGASTVPIPRTTRSAESAQGNLATDALRSQYEGIDFAFQNSGGLRAPLTTSARDEDGNYEIKRENVLEVWPFGNAVWVAEIDGTQLAAILANGVREIGGGRFIQLSGMRIEYSIDESVPLADNNGFPRGVIEVVEYWNHDEEADGTPVDLSAGASYRIALNDFMAVGGDGYPNIAESAVLRDVALDLAVENYLLEASPVSPQVEGRITEHQPPPPPPPAAGPAGCAKRPSHAPATPACEPRTGPPGPPATPPGQGKAR